MNELHSAFEVLGLKLGSSAISVRKRMRELVQELNPLGLPSKELTLILRTEIEKISCSGNKLLDHFNSSQHINAHACACGTYASRNYSQAEQNLDARVDPNNKLHLAYLQMNLPVGVELKEILKQFKKWALLRHPDIARTESERIYFTDEFRKIIQAKELLFRHFRSSDHSNSDHCLCKLPKPAAKAQYSTTHTALNIESVKKPRKCAQPTSSSVSHPITRSQFIKQNPNRRYPLFVHACSFLAQEKWCEAIACFSTLIDAFPDRAHFYIRRGSAYEHLNKLGNAIQDYSTAILLEPHSSNHLVRRAIVFKKSGKQEMYTMDMNAVQRLSGESKQDCG